jgi:prevent-host-death family protein
MWMFEVVLSDGAHVQAYKHSETRGYLHLDDNGRAFVYEDPDRYRQIPILELVPFGDPDLRLRFVTTMATRMGIRELRDSLTATIRRVQRGETIEVTNHGKAVAVLAPVPSDPLERLIAAGEATPGKPLEGPIRLHPVTGSMTASEALEEDRAER